MAVSAKFVADFSQFSDAVLKADVKLKSFQDGIGRVDRELAKFGNQFSGVKIVQDATLAARAIEKLGEEGGIAAGLTKLTANELQRVGSLAKEAATKLTAMGQEVPQHLQAIVKATTPIPEKLTLSAKAADLAKSSFAQMFGAFTAVNLVTGAVTGLINFGKSAVESAGRTADLSAKLGIGTEAIQRMDFVAKQTGGTVEQFASAAFKLQTRLSGGSDSVVSAVGQLGIAFTDLKNKKPEQQFEQVVSALGKMDDATKRNEVGVAIFGKSFESIASSVAQNYGKIASQATVSTDAQIQALDRAGDAWENFKSRQAANLTSILGNTIQTFDAIREVISERGVFTSTKGVIDEARRRVQTGTVGGRKEDIGLGTGAGDAAKTADFVAQLQKAQVAMNALTKEQRAQINAALQLGVSTDALSDRYGVSEEVLKLYTGQVKVASKESSNFARDLEAHKKEADAFSNALFGNDVIVRAAKYVDAIGDVRNADRLSAETKRDVSEALDEAIRLMGNQAPRAMLLLREAIRPTQAELRKLEQVVENTTVDLKELSRIPPPLEAFQRDLHKLETTFQTTGINGLLTNLGDELKAISDLGPRPASVLDKFSESLKKFDIPGTLIRALEGGGGFKGAAEAIGTRIGADIGKSIGTAIGGKFGGEVGEAAGSLLVKGIVKGVTSKNAGIRIATGFAVAGPLGALAAGIFGGRGPSKEELEGREAVKKLEAEMQKLLTTTQRLEAGSEKWKMTVIAARDAYLATGRSAADAERDVKRLWDSSVEGAEAAAKAAEPLLEALAEQQADIERLDAAIQKYGFSIEELGPAMRNQRLTEQAKELIEDWRVLVGSGIDLSLVNERMAESVNDYLKMAIRTGTEVPIAMRPILQTMLEQGTLLDEGGNAITDLGKAGISFAETMTQGFDRVVEKLQILIDRLNGAGHAIENLPAIDLPVNIPDIERTLRDRLGFAGRFGGLMADGGFGTVSQPTLFVAGESGPEQFAFSGANKSFAAQTDMSGVEERLDSVERHLRALPRALSIAMQDAMALS